MQSLSGKKLLVLAGNYVHVKIVKAAQALGVYTIVTDYLPPEKSPAKLVADEYWMLSTGDIDAVVEKCREQHVDGVITFCIDTVQFHYLRICERLGVPCYGTQHQFNVMTNKRLFKDFCTSNGVDVIPEYSIDDVENDNVVYPVLVKPTDSRGSRGQTVCMNKESIQNAIKFASEESKDGGYLIERYMSKAHDMGFAYIVINKQPYLLKISDRILGDKQYKLDRQQIASILPSSYTKEYVDNIEQNVIKMIKALKIVFGVVFLQGFYEDGRVYMYDPGLRFPGSDFDIVLKEATGFDSMTSFVYFALTGDNTSQFGNPIRAYNYNGKVCLIMAIAIRAGKICTITGMESISQKKEVYSAELWHHVGDVIENTGDVRQRAAEFCCMLPNRKAIPEFIQYVYNTLSILDENGKDMIISKLDINKDY